uniref:Uncharacterized protein n=1 Tax=Tanacetum cinerariifolium TaxID=118510 RepID=A0A6L2NHI3_TANCI|nr:hypothetical protein [Tanacetum cinerariifolium]
MTSLADKAILSGADNRPPMLEKDMYDSWKSRMELYMLNPQHGRMILESVKIGTLLWPSIEENGVTRLKKYSKLSTTVAIQADCDVKATNIILQGLPPEVYALVSTHKYASQAPSTTPLLLTYPSNDFQSSMNHNVSNPSSLMSHVEYAPAVYQQSGYSSPDTGLIVPVLQKDGDPIDAINHMISFLTLVVTLRVTSQPIQGRQNSLTAGSSRPYTSGSSRTSGKQRVIVCYNYKGEGHMSKQFTKPKRRRDEQWFKDKIALMENLSHYGSNNLAEKEESRNIDRELALEKHVKELNNNETLKLAKESRSKIIQKQNKPIMFEKKAELSNEQAFWFRYSVQPEEPNLSVSTTIVEVSKELPKVSMVNSSLKKLKFYLASIDMVVKERTTATTITEGTWGFEYTKACFRDDIIPFVKALKELFNSFDQFFIDELFEVQSVFNQMEQAVEQHFVEKNKFQDKMEKVLKDNNRLLEQVISIDIVNTVVQDHVNSADKTVNVCERCVSIKTEFPKDFI